MEKEVWKPIKGYEGKYEVSNFGKVKSFLVNPIGEMMILSLNKKGYFRIGLSNKGTQKCYSVHRLVGEAFVPNLNGKPHINHIDHNKQNNFFKNLEWVTNRENSFHFRKSQDSSSKYVGVSYIRKKKLWVAQIQVECTHYHLGFFRKEIKAKSAYNFALNQWVKKGIAPERIKTKLYQKDKNGATINVFKSLKEAEEHGFCMDNISLSIHGKYPHKNNCYRGYVWEYERINIYKNL